jgi:hypothetical protein
MSLNPNSPSSFETALNKTTGSRYSYSRKRRDGFNAWQEHVRKSAVPAGGVPFARRDRDLPRAVVPG